MGPWLMMVYLRRRRTKTGHGNVFAVRSFALFGGGDRGNSSNCANAEQCEQFTLYEECEQRTVHIERTVWTRKQAKSWRCYMKGIYSVYMFTGFRFARPVVGLRLVVFRLLQIHKTGQQFAHYCIVVSVWYKLHLETDISLIQNYFLTANRSIQRWCVFWDKVHLEASQGERWRIMNEPVFKSCKTRLRKITGATES